MALTGVKGPDRVLYGLGALLQTKLPGKLQNNSSFCSKTLLIPAAGTLSFAVNGLEYSITITSSANLISEINAAGTPLEAASFTSDSVILSCSDSVRFLADFGNVKKGQLSISSKISKIESFIISGTIPAENQIKLFPAIIINLGSISPEPDGIICSYGVDLIVAVTTPLSTSQVDLLSKQLMVIYDAINEILTVDDDGSLNGLVNGVIINSASIQDVTGSNNYLKLLNISLTVKVEED